MGKPKEKYKASPDVSETINNNNYTKPVEIKTFEDLLEISGGFGKFQGLLLLFILFYEIPAGFLAFVPVFVGAVPQMWRCGDDGENVTVGEICGCMNSTGEKVEAWNPTYSIVAEWELICSKSWVSSFITSIQMFGMLFGNLIPSQLSDWYGRKITFLLLMVSMALGQCVSAIATDPYTYGAARFICGFGLAGYFSLNGIYTMEFLTPKWRQLGGCLGPLGESLIILGVVAYLVRPWRLLLWATAFPFVTVMFVFPFLPESPRWLLRQKRYDEAAGVLEYIGRINYNRRFHLTKEAEVALKDIAEKENGNGGGSTTTSSERFTYLDLLRLKSVRGKTLIFIGIWFCWAFTFFGLSYNIRNYGVDPYLLTVLMGVVDAIGFRAALLVNNRLGRRKALVLFTGLSAAFFLPVGTLQLFIPPDGGFHYIPAILLGKMCVAGARSAIRVLTVESYPVSIRTMGFGVSRVSAALGGIAAPQIAYLGSKWPSLPLFAFGTLGFLGSLLSLLLKETSGKPLEDELKKDNGVRAIGWNGNNKVGDILDTKRTRSKSI